MKLIDPKVELWSEENVTPSQHVARCARVCYGGEDKPHTAEQDDKLFNSLINRGHMSMLRHGSSYGFISGKIPQDCMRSEFLESRYTTAAFANGFDVSTNLQFRYEHPEVKFVHLTNDEMLSLCREDNFLFELYRLTFCITTQISTSRELNRVSPNNIAERSTRFCSSKDGLEICKPWWIDTPNIEDDIARKKAWYIDALNEAEATYKVLLEKGMKPEDARGILPLDTATKVIYTYSVKEWKHIIDLRYYGTTGKPHPNAKLVIGMVRDLINDFAKQHGIDYKL